MTVYVDSSALLRILLRQPGELAEWRRIDRAITSLLTEVECLRTLDRLRLRTGLSDRQLAVRREAVFRFLDAMEVVEVTAPVLSRAAQPFPTELGTLDAVHLSTALLWKDRSAADIVLATHDEMLATAARAVGLTVIGRAGR